MAKQPTPTFQRTEHTVKKAGLTWNGMEVPVGGKVTLAPNQVEKLKKDGYI